MLLCQPAYFDICVYLCVVKIFVMHSSSSPFFFLWKALDSQPCADKSLLLGGLSTQPCGGGWIRQGAGTGLSARGSADAHLGAVHPQGATGSINYALLQRAAESCPGAGNITNSASFSSSGFLIAL